jgi:hypothetical protein
MTAQEQPKTIDLLELTESEKTSFIKEIRKNLRLKLEEAEFWRSLAESHHITVNGLTIEL